MRISLVLLGIFLVLSGTFFVLFCTFVDNTDKALEWRGLFCTGGDLHAHFFSPSQLPELSIAAAGGRSSSVFLEANQAGGGTVEGGSHGEERVLYGLHPHLLSCHQYQKPPAPTAPEITTSNKGLISTMLYWMGPSLENWHIPFHWMQNSRGEKSTAVP